MTRTERIKAALAAAFTPTLLVVEDDSERHHGHSGYGADGQSHYSVTIVSAAFEGKTRVARHRLVTDRLADEFASGLHALSLTARTPSEVS